MAMRVSSFLRPPFPCLQNRSRSGMAWMASGTSNSSMVDALVEHSLIRSARVEAAMRAVDRGSFCAHAPYADAPQLLTCSATISAPHMHAMALELLERVLVPGASALDVGTGSGYLAACFATLVKPAGKVVGVEHVEQLTQLASRNIRSWNRAALDDGLIKLRTADGRLGAEDEAPFAAIHVGAASPDIPQRLIDQLDVNGRMVIPVGGEHETQSLVVVDKLDGEGNIETKSVCSVRYVPLCNVEHQLRGY